jgi:hypothetical protein
MKRDNTTLEKSPDLGLVLCDLCNYAERSIVITKSLDLHSPFPLFHTLTMKTVAISAILAGLAAAHSAVWSVDIDASTYPARDARFDDKFGAKRVEWSFDDAQGFTWAAVTNVSDPGIACKNANTMRCSKTNQERWCQRKSSCPARKGKSRSYG